MRTNLVDRSLYPFDSHFLDRHGFRYHYLDEGPRDGEVLLMLHGNPTWSFYFRNLCQSLRNRYRIIVPDHMGCGLSDRPSLDSYGYRLMNRVLDVEALLSELGIQKVTLVVHDWGGMIGLTFATRHPERINRIIMLNTAGFHIPSGKRLPFRLRLARDSALGAFLILRANAFSLAAQLFCAKKKLPKNVRQGYLAPQKNRRDRLAVLQFVKDIPLHPGDPSFQTVTETQVGLKKLSHIPCLILWGQKDFVFDDHFLTEWEETMPWAEIIRFPLAGHFVLEDEFQNCLSSIQDFLSRTQLH